MNYKQRFQTELTAIFTTEIFFESESKKHIKTSQDHRGFFLTHFTFHPGVIRHVYSRGKGLELPSVLLYDSKKRNTFCQWFMTLSFSNK